MEQNQKIIDEYVAGKSIAALLREYPDYTRGKINKILLDRGRLQVLKILDVLYSQSPRFLKRKYDKYIALKESLK